MRTRVGADLAARDLVGRSASAALLMMTLAGGLVAPLWLAAAPAPAMAQPGDAPDFPPFAEVSRGLEKVVSTADGQAPLYTLYKRDRDARLLAELPRGFENQRIFIATTIAGGAPTSGIQLGGQLAYWKRYDKRLALVEPNVAVRTTASDPESKRAEELVFTDRVLLDVPIVAMGPGGGPVIDLAGMLVGESDRFFGGATGGANRRLVTLTKVKAFPQNVEVAAQMPDRSGRLLTIHYSLRLIPGRGSYQPRVADPRVGYFATAFRDISKQDRDTQWVRYINRWHLEKRNPQLQLSPPKEPIVFYIDAAVPVHYRRWVREGLLEWNKAFAKIGFDNAIEVYQQDASTSAHMDKDPEDARYNFVRWTSADIGFAIGPSRVHPETGQILDADVVIDDGFLRGWSRTFQDLLPEVAMTGMPAEVVAWLGERPGWDPRVRLAVPAEREMRAKQVQIERARVAEAMVQAAREGKLEERLPMIALRSGASLGFNPTANLGPIGAAGADDLDARFARCSAMLGKSVDVALMRYTLASIDALADEPEAKDKDKDQDDKSKDAKGAKDAKDARKEPRKTEPLIDGMPESFVGPLLKDLVMHEVGHTLGLRHNFKASSIYTLDQINSPQWKGSKAITGSVMDYSPVNVNFNKDRAQGDYSMVTLGTYDFWAIEYGYTTGDTKPILARVSEPELAFGTDEDVGGPDPRIKQFDMGAQPLDFADETILMVRELRGRILGKIVKDGDSWQRARDAYTLLLARQMGAVRTASQFLGGVNLVRDRKGDPGNRSPVTPGDPAEQRRALKFVLENAFRDQAFGLDRELLAKMTVDKWFDDGGRRTLGADPAWPIHDQILGFQASALTMLLNPAVLQRVYDNELRTPPGTDTLTLPELISALSGEVFGELGGLKGGTAREPSISSIRRNLQREYLERLIDLTLPDAGFAAAYKPVSNLIVQELRQLKDRIDTAAKNGALDPYSRAHLAEAGLRIGKALEAQYIYNGSSFGRGGGGLGFFFSPGPADSASPPASSPSVSSPSAPPASPGAPAAPTVGPAAGN